MKHTLIYSSLSLVISLLLVVLIVHVQGQRSLPDLSPKDQLIFVENFESEESLKKFKIGQADLGHSAGQEDSPAWRIENGQLRAENAHNAALWLKTPLPLGDIRIVFLATALSEQGDVKCEVFGDGSNHQSGYILINGGWKNSVRAIARQDEHGEDRHDDHRCSTGPTHRCVPENQTQEWVIERRGSRIDWYIDGVFTLTLSDAHPIQGRHFGFNNWSAAVLFDHLRIYQLSE